MGNTTSPEIIVISYGRLVAELPSYLSDGHTSIISIRGKWSGWISAPSLEPDRLLHVCFEDWTEKVPGRTITSKIASELVSFGCNSIKRGDRLIIHCEAGQSRSAACGIALDVLTGVPVRFREHQDVVLFGGALCEYRDYGIYPNQLVLQTLMRAATGPDELVRACLSGTREQQESFVAGILHLVRSFFKP